MSKIKKTIVVINDIEYEIPTIVFDSFKDVALERDILEIVVDNLKLYIHNHIGTNAKA